jgi:hypothetical protein
MRALERDDPVDLMYLAVVAEDVERRRERDRKLLALEIVNTLAKALK